MSPAGRIALSSALLVAAVSAQSANDVISSLTGTCKDAATGLVASPFAECANVGGLISVVTADGSIVEPINSWVTDLCKQAPCAQADIDNAKSTIEGACARDIQDGNVGAVGLDTIVKNFPTVKEAMCQQAASNDTFCITQFLTAAQASLGTDLTTDNLQDLLGSVQSFQRTVSKLPSSDICTDCNHAILSKIAPILESEESSSLNSAASDECGASFVDGQVPSSVKAASSEDSAASRLVASASAVVAGAAGFFLLA